MAVRWGTLRPLAWRHLHQIPWALSQVNWVAIVMSLFGHRDIPRDFGIDL